MNKLRTWASVILTLGILGLIGLAIMFLALVDISHGEENVVGEWLIVRLGLLAFFFIFFFAIIFATLIIRYFRDGERPSKS